MNLSLGLCIVLDVVLSLSLAFYYEKSFVTDRNVAKLQQDGLSWSFSVQLHYTHFEDWTTKVYSTTSEWSHRRELEERASIIGEMKPRLLACVVVLEGTEVQQTLF